MNRERRNRAINALKSREFATAVEILAEYVPQALDDDEARLAFALALSGIGDHKKSIFHIDKLLEKLPGSASLLWQRAMVLQRAHQPAEAAQTLRVLLKHAPDHQKARERLAKLSTTIDAGFEVIEDDEAES